ncbi:hypothetical protein COY62_03940 [bacterium (Candidatus Howlettbacteria) CG_4_10_14_0_8_um_filter_40_9]|nr:MAG: hypothetical protein COY62_03940 [bacterium (Candidatus Howlettbacteria) CG_4_10_14_0_8_um_filter_40_9]
MLIKFGDVFNYGEKDYVFLAKTEDIIYVAEILDTESTKRIKEFTEKEIRKNKDNWQKRPLFC